MNYFSNFFGCYDFPPILLPSPNRSFQGLSKFTNKPRAGRKKKR